MCAWRCCPVPRTGFELGMLDPRDKMQLTDAARVATRAFRFDPFLVHLSP